MNLIYLIYVYNPFEEVSMKETLNLGLCCSYENGCDSGGSARRPFATLDHHEFLPLTSNDTPKMSFRDLQFGAN